MRRKAVCTLRTCAASFSPTTRSTERGVHLGSTAALGPAFAWPPRSRSSDVSCAPLALRAATRVLMRESAPVSRPPATPAPNELTNSL